MTLTTVFRVTLAVSLAAFTPFATAQGAGTSKPPADALFDDPADRPAPDPLAEEDKNGSAPLAPGASSERSSESPLGQLFGADPVSEQILSRLASLGGRQDAREDVSGLIAYYKEVKGRPIWTDSDGFLQNALKAIKEIRSADDWGLDSSAFQLPANPEKDASPAALADAEIKLSLAVLKYARHARGGRLDPPSISDIIDRHPRVYDPKSVLQGIAVAAAAGSADAYLRGLHPKHEQFKRLRQALLSLKSGGGGAVATNPERIPSGPTFRPGDTDPQIALIRKRLGADASDSYDFYDTPLVEAVNRYQKDHGLQPTGIIDKKLRASLNEGIGAAAPAATPDEKRMRILVNMERWRWMPDDLGEFYVWNNITEQLTRVFDHGRMVLQERIVVGKPVTPTPTFSANMQFVTFNPEWGVPDGIKEKEIGPKLRRAGARGDDEDFFTVGRGGGGARQVLQRMGGLRVTYNGREVDPDSVNWSNVDIKRYQFIQGAGPRNVLGVVKFRFPNKHDVYMHDTPDRHLFGSSQRAFSHGCMRTQNPLHVAEVVLAHDKGWSPSQVQEAVQSGATDEVKLSTRIPVHIVYFTAEVDEHGQLRTFPDIYGLDAKIASALKGQPVRFTNDPVVTAENKSRPRPDEEGPAWDGGERQDPYAPPREQPYGDRRDPYASQQDPYGRPRFRLFGRSWSPFEDWN